jgi:predicted Zn-ribbon and HTH transcriptional regulator
VGPEPDRDDKPQTLRKEIAKALAEGPMDLREISQLFRIREKDVLDHLLHISRSARLKMDPAVCLECGFSFKKRDRLNTPSRCPLCKSESISPPRYQVIG